ncbi:cytochrome c oxidase assembly protein [Thalassospira mesophila]|uniref:cytochrome c oxidase assembly protein n=1 Tax=Thalassospira mesophila TaxID=1293891 RepID=UPI001302A076|nr:cytochrome c oxidase assembly protein [Thalassospira mesophila]
MIFCLAAILVGGFVGFKVASSLGLRSTNGADVTIGEITPALATPATPAAASGTGGNAQVVQVGGAAMETTGLAGSNNAPVRAKTIKISFGASSDPAMDWEFAPEQASMTVALGENKMAFYAAHNLSNKVVTGEAAYSVTPVEAGRYVNKLACFCFDAQRLAPGENVDMPISFFVDPAIADDPALRDLSEIKLSFAFYAVKTAAQATDRSGESGG